MQENVTVSTVLSFIDTYTRELVIAGLVMAGGVYGIYHYFQSRTHKEQVATSSLFETVEELERAYSSTGDWKEVDIAAKTGMHAHKNSSLNPYFKVVAAQAEAQQGALEEAVVLLDSALSAMPSNLVLRYLVATTQAQIKLDSSEQSVRQQAVEQLATLSEDSNNIFKDKALYYLYEYYQLQGDAQKAQAIQEQLQAFVADTKEQSAWAQQVASQLG